jgi:hypothetical protein
VSHTHSGEPMPGPRATMQEGPSGSLNLAACRKTKSPAPKWAFIFFLSPSTPKPISLGSKRNHGMTFKGKKPWTLSCKPAGAGPRGRPQNRWYVTYAHCVRYFCSPLYACLGGDSRYGLELVATVTAHTFCRGMDMCKLCGVCVAIAVPLVL